MYNRSRQWSDGNADTDSTAAAAGDINSSSQHTVHTTDDDATAAILASLQRQRSNQSLTSNSSQQQQQSHTVAASSAHDADVFASLSESARNLYDQIPDLTYMLQTQIQVPVKGVMTGSGMRTRVLSDAFNFDDS
jgi:methyl-accepting chemotaxis protein